MIIFLRSFHLNNINIIIIKDHSVKCKMHTTKVHNSVYIFLTFVASSFANTENVPLYIQTLPRFDPRLTEYVWFSSQTKPDNHHSSSSIKILPFLLPGAVETLMDISKERNKEQNEVPKVEKMSLRL
jgi:hypothetical protein